MITLSQTAGEDKDLILIVRINLDTEYMYFSDTVDQITLSGIAFDGKVISKNSISEATKDVDVTSGGTIGQVGNWNLSLARYTSYNNGTTTFDDFFNDFAPATSKPLLTSKTVDVGVVWTGATTTAEITWLYQFYIESYDWTTYSLNLGCIEYDELVATQLPYYVVQKENDNGISYFPDAPDANYGLPIPLMFGDFAYTALEYEMYRLAPTVQISGGYKFIASSHICKYVEPASYLFEYLNPIKTVMRLSSASGTNINSRAGHIIDLANETAPVYGKLYVILRSWLSGGTDINNALDNDINTYGTLNVSTTAKLKFAGNLSEDQLGQLDGDVTVGQCKFNIIWEALSTVSGLLRLYHPDFINNPLGGYHALSKTVTGSALQTTAYDFGLGNFMWSSIPAKQTSTPAWSAKELDFVEFHIINNATSAQMKIYHCYLEFTDVLKYGRPKTDGLRTRDNTGERNYISPRRPIKSLLKYTELVDETQIFCYAKGYMYDYWIDYLF